MVKQTTDPAPPPGRPTPTGLHRLLKVLPSLALFALIGLIVVLNWEIRSEGEMIKERKHSELRSERPATNVITMEMMPQRLQEKITLPGHVKPWIHLNVVTEVKGKIVEKHVSEGSRVHKGDLLATIDARDYANALASAQAAFDVAAASEKRLRKLFADRVATQAQLDDIVAQRRTARAALENAALAFERCTIRAPMDGVVDRIFVEPGQFLDVGAPVATLLDIDRVKVEVGIPESDVDAVRRLDRFEITVDALAGRRFEGTRHYLQRTTESLARLYNLEIAVANPQGEILPDMFVRATIVKSQVDEGLAVPLYALVKRNETDALFVVREGVAHLQPVEPGIQDGWHRQIRRGISAGELVVVVGQRNIEEGEPVHVTRTVRSMAELTQ